MADTMAEFVSMVSRLTHTGDDGWTPPSHDDDSSDVVDSLIAQAREIQSFATQPATNQEEEMYEADIANKAVMANLNEDGTCKYQSAQGYACAREAVRLTLAALGIPPTKNAGGNNDEYFNNGHEE